MSGIEFSATVSAGSLRPENGAGICMPHQWTDDGVVIDVDFTGGHLYHLAVAGCVLNDVYREAAGLGIAIQGVRVHAGGCLDTTTWSSTGIEYEVEVASDAAAEQIELLLTTVDEVAEIPKALRSGTSVTRNTA